jgi:hypothetical protein
MVTMTFTPLTQQHISDDSLERYSMGRLTEAQIAPIEEHLLICEECRDRLVLADFDIAVIRKVLKQRRERIQ